MDAPRRRAANETSADSQQSPGYPGIFYFALTAFIVALIALVIVAARALTTSDGRPVFPELSAKPTNTVEATSEAPTGLSSPVATKPPAATSTSTGPSTSTVTCSDILAPVDKEHALGADCSPGDLQAIPAEFSANGQQFLRAAAASALIDMFKAGAKDGHRLLANSGYRSYQTQVVVFNNEVATYGLEQAQRQSARPGHSEHQMGTAMDITSPSGSNDLVESFGATLEGKWLAANAATFGFVLSYPPGKEAITGYIYEPWHFRYVGKDQAAAVRGSGLTLHEYLLRR